MNDVLTSLRSLARQEQFLDLVDRDTAMARFYRYLDLRPLGAETVPLSRALGRILARAVIADVDVPGFDRSSVDGFAVRADDTVGATERAPKARFVASARDGWKPLRCSHGCRSARRFRMLPHVCSSSVGTHGWRPRRQRL